MHHAAPSGAAGVGLGSDPRVSPVAKFSASLREAPAVRLASTTILGLRIP